MTTYSVAEAKDNLPKLIDRAINGEQVVITRHGKPVAELRAADTPRAPRSAVTHEWLRERRLARAAVGISSVDLLNQLYDDPEE